MERAKLTIRSAIRRSGVVVGVGILLALLGHDIGVAVAASHGSTSVTHGDTVHTLTADASAGEHPAPQDDCRTDDHASAMAAQSRPDLPAAVASDTCIPSPAPAAAPPLVPTAAPPLASAERRVILQVFLN